MEKGMEICATIISMLNAGNSIKEIADSTGVKEEIVRGYAALIDKA